MDRLRAAARRVSTVEQPSLFPGPQAARRQATPHTQGPPESILFRSAIAEKHIHHTEKVVSVAELSRELAMVQRHGTADPSAYAKPERELVHRGRWDREFDSGFAGDADATYLRYQGRRKAAVRVVCCVAAARGGLALRRFARSQGGVRAVAGRVAVTTKEIIERRLIVPAVEVLADLLSPSKEHLMADPQSLRQAEATLEAMLTDWLRDRESTLSSDEIAALAKKGDLTSVGETLAAETRKPLTGLISGADTVSLHNPHAVAATRRLASAGNIVRALLIQLQAVSYTHLTLPTKA
mgnify:CR=1 FL=1